jgi:hypothetical protein
MMSSFYSPPIRPAAKAAFEKIHKQQHADRNIQVKKEGVEGEQHTRHNTTRAATTTSTSTKKKITSDHLQRSPEMHHITKKRESFASSFRHHLIRAYHTVQEDELESEQFLASRKTDESTEIDYSDFLLSSRNFTWLRGMDTPACGLFLAAKSSKQILPLEEKQINGTSQTNIDTHPRIKSEPVHDTDNDVAMVSTAPTSSSDHRKSSSSRKRNKQKRSDPRRKSNQPKSKHGDTFV